MIFGLMHQGSGIGNQLHRYVATRVLADELKTDFSMIGEFKGKSFMNLDLGGGMKKEWDYLVDPAGKIIVDTHFDDSLEFEEKTNYFNPEFFFQRDNTIIDGEFQSIQYFGHRLDDIDKWLEVEPLEVSDDTCVINFRGGEFYTDPQLGLPKEYYDLAIKVMEIAGVYNFEVHTDDVLTAKEFFPDYRVVHDTGFNWRALRYSKFAIISNSSFAILPRLLSKGVTIAPRFWARRNIGEWSRPDNYYKNFNYL